MLWDIWAVDMNEKLRKLHCFRFRAKANCMYTFGCMLLSHLMFVLYIEIQHFSLVRLDPRITVAVRYNLQGVRLNKTLRQNDILKRSFKQCSLYDLIPWCIVPKTQHKSFFTFRYFVIAFTVWLEVYKWVKLYVIY
jgi:hypothetical protein